MKVAAINCTNCIFEIGEEFGIVSYVGWARISANWELDMIGIKGW